MDKATIFFIGLALGIMITYILLNEKVLNRQITLAIPEQNTLKKTKTLKFGVDRFRPTFLWERSKEECQNS